MADGRSHRHWALAGVGALLAATALMTTATAAPSSGYTAPVVAIPTAPGSTNIGYGTGGEPRLIVTRDGRVVVAAHMSQWDCVTGKPSPGDGHQCVWMSRDDGRTFRFSGGELNQVGDDVDLVESGGVLLESTMTNKGLGTGTPGTTVSRSTDGGRTWTETVAVNKTLANDRPFMLAVPDGSVVITYDAIPGGIQFVRSTDHGATWSLPAPIAIPSNGGPLVAINGAPAVDPKRRQLLVPYGVSSGVCTAGANGCFDTFSLARGGYDGTGWTSEPVVTLQEGAGAQSVMSMAADAAGTDYLVIGSARGSSGTTAADRDAHVSVAVQRAGSPGWELRRVDKGGSAMVPNIVAGAAGRVVVTYYWSPYSDAQSTARPWYVVVADSHDSGRTFTNTVISKMVWVGAAKDHQFTLWDLFGVTLDRRGRAHVAWTQVSGTTPDGPLTEIAYSRQR